MSTRVNSVFLSPFRTANDLCRALIKPSASGAPSPWCLEMTAVALIVPFLIVLLHIWDAQIVKAAMNSDMLLMVWLRYSTDLIRTKIWLAVGIIVWISSACLLTPSVHLKFREIVIQLHAWATFILLSILVGSIPTELGKLVIGRARPVLLEELGATHFSPFNATHSFESFPSGHSMMAGIMLISLWIFLPKLRFLTVLLCLSFPVSRLAAGAHYPTDVLAGVTIGVLSACWVARYMASRNIIFSFDAGRVFPKL